MIRHTALRLLLLAVLLLAFGLRLHRLDAQSFWNDEGNSARLSERPLPAIVEGTASDIHPPLYYLLLRGWRELAGETEFGLRSFSAFAGLGVVAGTIALARALRRRHPSAALLAGLLTAVSPALVYYSQETRMYALLALEAALATWLLISDFGFRTTDFGFRISDFGFRSARGRLRTTDDGLRLTDNGSRPTNDGLRLTDNGSRTTGTKWPAYALVVAAGLYTHYFFPAVLLGHALYLALRTFAAYRSPLRALRALRPWLLATVAAGLLYAPWLPIFLRQAGGRVGGGMDGRFFRDAWRWLVVGDTLPAAEATWPLLAAALLALLGLWQGRLRALLPALLLATPVAFMAATGATQSQYFKFLGVAVPFLALLLANALPFPNPKSKIQNPTRLLAAAALLLVLWAGARSLHNLYTDPAYARADYRGMAARIQADGHPNAGVILNAPNQWEVFTYYFSDVERVYPLPRGQPDAAVLDAELTAIAARHERLYAIFWGEAQRDPQRLVERWLDANAFKATEVWVGDVRFVTYAVPGKPAAAMQTAVHLRFGDHITLQGYTLRAASLRPADIIQLTLFWETAVALDQRYKVFLHLVDADGALVAQRDAEPGGGLNLTTIWEPNATIVDNHGILIPPGTPPGAYTLYLGLYDLADPAARLPIRAPVELGDAYPLTEITVLP
ncbi:MAG: glycosyltransferase family 39 protein [Anaerolineales bacterium]|nr:glycosyltransferase family 39 protein [Anaerolineales bacterium]